MIGAVILHTNIMENYVVEVPHCVHNNWGGMGHNPDNGGAQTSAMNAVPTQELPSNCQNGGLGGMAG